MFGQPSVNNYNMLVRVKLLDNCLVTVENIEVAKKVYGSDVAALKGKTTRPKLPVVRQHVLVVPPVIRQYHNDVKLVADVMFVNKLPFLVTLSKKLVFG